MAVLCSYKTEHLMPAISVCFTVPISLAYKRYTRLAANGKVDIHAAAHHLRPRLPPE